MRKWLKRMRGRELDARAEQARREADLSRERLRRAREHVIGPLERQAARNHFADLIRASLTEGRDS